MAVYVRNEMHQHTDTHIEMRMNKFGEMKNGNNQVRETHSSNQEWECERWEGGMKWIDKR